MGARRTTRPAGARPASAPTERPAEAAPAESAAPGPAAPANAKRPATSAAAPAAEVPLRNFELLILNDPAPDPMLTAKPVRPHSAPARPSQAAPSRLSKTAEASADEEPQPQELKVDGAAVRPTSAPAGPRPHAVPVAPAPQPPAGVLQRRGRGHRQPRRRNPRQARPLSSPRTSNAGELTDEQFLEKTQELAGSSVVEDVGD